MQFPSPFTPDPQHRAGRMMLAGRVKVTCASEKHNWHITVALKCFADNRNRQFDAEKQKNWVECQLADATHIFVEVPRPDGGYADKIGTFYPRSNRWYDADNADPQRVHVAQLIGHWLCGHWDGENIVTGNEMYGPLSFLEAEECGVCGRELTDPESISRGIGPICFGRMTDSQHQVKGDGMSNIRNLIADTNEEHDVTGLQIGNKSISNEELRSEAMATTEDRYSHGTNPSAPAQDEDLGIEVPTGAVNALYSILDSMNLEQLHEVEERVDTLIIKRQDAQIKQMRTGSKDADREALGR
jgi:hypothetical protein